jgi:hypothetical protein
MEKLNSFSDFLITIGLIPGSSSIPLWFQWAAIGVGAVGTFLIWTHAIMGRDFFARLPVSPQFAGGIMYLSVVLLGLFAQLYLLEVIMFIGTVWVAEKISPGHFEYLFEKKKYENDPVILD